MSELKSLIQQRYGNEQIIPEELKNIDISGLNNPVLTALLSHASLRQFSDQAISSEILSLLIASAQSASTSSNLQAWTVISVQNKAHKEKLASFAANQTFIQDAPVFLIWTIDLRRSVDVIQLTRSEHDIKQTIGLESVDSLLVGTIDATLAAQNLTIAAQSLGLGSVYVGAIRNNLQQVVEVLELPQGVIPIFGIALGYPKEDVIKKIKPRLPQEIILHHDVYQSQKRINESVLNIYEKNLNIFQQQSGQQQERWRDKVTQRLSSLNGREYLADTFNRQGLNVFNVNESE
ncbi:hypothetical protein B9T31_13625 [Acinetobacter sp. ANC 4558]|uniref:nitroreductase family protein n=1 Tax=Acinetobacter sp. ANC 4558 TaxID=1977876 RepID=UPI000A3485F7|nr:nitroreductase family protein [Acinetobacter sp. ANC 4558]OTG84191.1 hypothetical protein B9T31_13625 [Acinetobacter sp. ANC 4558]